MSVSQTIADAFDIDLSEKQVEDATERINEIKTSAAEQKYSLEDKEYIRAELQSLIESNRTVLETLGEQCKLRITGRECMRCTQLCPTRLRLTQWI